MVGDSASIWSASNGTRLTTSHPKILCLNSSRSPADLEEVYMGMLRTVSWRSIMLATDILIARRISIVTYLPLRSRLEVQRFSRITGAVCKRYLSN